MPDESASPPLAVVILGTDAVLAAAPATPVQLAHACLAAGYGAVVPASWGDELIATECLRRTAMRGRDPIVCAICPRVADRLLANGGELAQFAMALVSPPVATARYLRAMCGDDRVRVTFIGACPGADDESIDERMTPKEFLGELAGRDIVMLEQPEVFDSVIPPDRRRFHSLPGGVPSPEALWAADGRTLIEIDDEDYVTDLAQRLINREHVLLDIAPKLGCACSGAVADVAPRSARIAVAAMEPPRSTTPVIDASVPVDLVRSLPAAPRALEIVLPPGLELPPPAPAARPAPVREERAPRTAPSPVVPRRKSSTPEGMAAIDPAAPQRRMGGGTSARAIVGAVPTVTSGEGRALPRAYVGRRRTGRTPPDNQAIRPDNPPPQTPPAERERPIEAVVEPAPQPVVVAPAKPAEAQPVATLARSRRERFERILREPLQLAVIIGVLIVASMLLGIVAGRRFIGAPGDSAPSADVREGNELQGVRSLSEEIPANQVIERAGTVGPELPAPSAPAPVRPPARGSRRAVPDATSRRTGAPRASAAAVVPPATEAVRPPTESVRQLAPAPTAAAPATRRDSIDRELQSIARELELRRARLDSLARRESLRTRPPR